MSVAFGEDIICPECDGTCVGPMNKTEQKERTRVLRIAKRRREEPPLLDRTCRACAGSGIQRTKGKYI